MDYPAPLLPATFLRRYKRFLADFHDPDGRLLTAHCANTGSMLGLLQLGAAALLSRSNNPQRKLAYSWELVQENNVWVGIHTGRSNALVREALTLGQLPTLRGYQKIQAEVPVGAHNRLDFRLEGARLPPCYVEVKSVTLRQGHVALFPDAVSKRGHRHLHCLAHLHQQGFRSVLLFVVQRQDCTLFRPAQSIDPAYAATLSQVVQGGVEILVHCCTVDPQGIRVRHAIPWELMQP